MTTLALVLFAIAWAIVVFLVIRALLTLWKSDRRLATAAAIAVAGAFFLGSASPFSLAKRVAEVTATPTPAMSFPSPRSISCVASAKLGTGTGTGNIDTVQVGQKAMDATKPVVLPANSRLQLGGWFITDKGLAQHACVVVDGKTVAFTGIYGIVRPDVATALNQPADAPAGFALTVQPPRGTHQVVLAVVESDGSLAAIGKPLTVVVR